MSYTRVIPRDLFNEAKLLKCLGQLALLIHDGVDQRKRATPPWLKIEYDGSPFVIDQEQSDGSLFCSSIRFALKCDDPFENRELHLWSIYNSKDAFPLMFLDCDDDVEFRVFNDDGTLSDDFISFCSR